MPRFGIVLEGPYDEKALKEFLRRCFGADCEIESRACATRGGVTRKFRNYLEEFRYRGDIQKAFVVRDADGKDPSQLTAQMQAMIENRAYPFPVKFAVIVQELEAWLLADHDAISTVTGRQTKRQPDPIEALNSPKERLQDLLSKAGLAYTEEVARKIAAAANVEKLRERCPAFRGFCQDASDC